MLSTATTAGRRGTKASVGVTAAASGFLLASAVLVLVYSWEKRKRNERYSSQSTAAGISKGIISKKRCRIFVSIASYRDPDTPNTLRDLFERANFPDRVFAGLVWQIAEGEDDFLEIPNEYRNQVRGIIVSARKSMGACWARHRIQSELYGGEEYYLMIDSHSRFADGWDDRFIEMLESCPSQHPALSTYPCAFTPPRNLWKSHLPSLKAGDFTKEGILLMATTSLGSPDLANIKPTPNAFMGANCFFARGSVVLDVPYDPHLYFHGEEISMAVRLWTQGYDLYTPSDVLMYHDYTPTNDTKRTRHWEDHKEWWKRNLLSFQRVRYLLTGEMGNDENEDKDDALVEIDRYGLGTKRTVAEFEKFADVSFSSRTVGERATKGSFPPEHFAVTG